MPRSDDIVMATQAENDKLKAEVARLTEANARLRKLLADLEWAGDRDYSLYDDALIASCPSCQAYQKNGHASDCPLKAELES